MKYEQQLRANSRQKQFTVHHYNHAVKYDADGFVERNRDRLHTSVAKLLGTSVNNMVKMCVIMRLAGRESSDTAMWRSTPGQLED